MHIYEEHLYRHVGGRAAMTHRMASSILKRLMSYQAFKWGPHVIFLNVVLCVSECFCRGAAHCRSGAPLAKAFNKGMLGNATHLLTS